MTLKVASIAKITGRSEKFTVYADKPLSLIQEAHAIPGGQVLEPASDVMAEFLIKFDPVMKIYTFMDVSIKQWRKA